MAIVVAALWAPLANAAAYNASHVLGQADFTSNTYATTQDGMSFPVGSAYDPINQRLFVSDCSNNRVLVFNVATSTISNDEDAEYVLGQADFTSNGATTTQNGMNCPYDVSYDIKSQRLFVPDVNNNRILVFNVATSTISNGEDAEYVLGQPDFTSDGATTTQSGMSDPQDASYDSANQRLFVVDFSNSRVLVFNVATSTISNGEDAEYVLGQAGFTSSNEVTTQDGMSGAYAASYDPESQRLFVVDSYNNRVLVFNVATSTISNDEDAEYVLGQADFTSNGATTTQKGINAPLGAPYDPVNQRLFVLDGDFRALVFDVATSTIANGEDAEFVLGRANFTSFNNTVITQSSMSTPYGASYDAVNQRLFVDDGDNNRVLVFDFASLASSSFESGVVGSPYSASISATSTQGTVSLTTSTGELPPGLALGTSTISGTPTATGTYAFSLQALDDNGAIGTISSNPVSYDIEIDPASPAVLSAVATSSITSSTAVISWTTDVSSLGTAYYGTTDSYGSSSVEAASSTSHSVTLAGLAPNTAYHFEVAADHLGTVSTSTDYTFTTAKASPAVISNIAKSSITSSGAVISFTTDVDATGTVYFGPTNAYGSSVAETESSTSHGITLSHLSDGTTYHFEVAADHLGTVSTSTDYTFTTAKGIIVMVASAGGPPPLISNPVAPPKDSTTTLSSSSTPSFSSTPTPSVFSLQAELDSLEAQLQILLKEAPSSASSFFFSRNLSLWMTGNDVQALQVFLNTHGYPVTSSGYGSLHHETFTFGNKTYAALVLFQRDHNIPATGFFGSLTRAAVVTGD